MKGIVISIFKSNGGTLFNLDYATGDFPQARTLWEFECHDDDGLFKQMRQGMRQEEVVRKAGRLLLENLLTHPAVKQAIEAALANAIGNIAPLYIHLNSEKVEALPWEALCSD